MTDKPLVLVVGAGYQGKRRAYVHLAHELGARMAVVDEPGHWSKSLVADGLAETWVEAPISGDPDVDAKAAVEAVTAAQLQPAGVLCFWEDSIATATRVAAALGLPGNPVDAVDSARSKVRTRELSAQLGLPTPRARRVRSLDELFAAAGEVGFPAVVKPEYGASAMGCVRVDSLDELPNVYSLVRDVVRPETDGIFRIGNDLLLEEYLDGVEFDVDLVMQDGQCLFSSVSQNWPTNEPSFQESGLHNPPDHDRRAVKRLVKLAIQTAQAFQLHRGVLHIEGKCTTRGPRIVEVNARMGGGRVWEMVRAVWGVDLVECQLLASLDQPIKLRPSRKPRCAVVDTLIYAEGPGVLTSLPIAAVAPSDELMLDVAAEVGEEVRGPEAIFASLLAEFVVVGDDLKDARERAARLLDNPPVVAPTG